MDIKRILSNARTIAVIGCSRKSWRTSHQVASYLQQQGYRIIPVHPEYEEVLGEKCYPRIYDIPEVTEIEIADIFRNSAHTLEMVEDICRRVDETGRKPLVWTQIGVSSPEARSRAEEAGLSYVADKCLMVEHRRLNPQSG